MKTATTIALLASLVVAAPAQRADSLDHSKRLNGPVTVDLEYSPVKDQEIEHNKLRVGLKYPHLLDPKDFETLQKRADSIV